ncbi:hypothetical protein [Aeromonas enteropelogenes]|uniref:hypothetical protein n=1 Tax=Aeromonas enteropelogenes TaxID=29489 RepID=UPI003BA3ADCE
MSGSSRGQSTWIADYDTIGQAYELAERLSVALAIPLTLQVPGLLMPVKRAPTAGAGAEAATKTN